VKPITPMDATPGTTTHVDIITKLNEVIHRLNFITTHGIPARRFISGPPERTTKEAT
jgi:hypothetical protein